jgi:hypothetical protein
MTQKPRLPGAIDCAVAPDGAFLYRAGFSAERLPAVRVRDLLSCWEAARALAEAGEWGAPRRFRFASPDDAPGGTVDVALIDPDACCWAEAVDGRAGLQTRYGMSLCLRLLALVDILARSAHAPALVRIEAGEAALHPGLVEAAASLALDPTGRLPGLEPLAAQSAACELLRLAPGCSQ